MIKVEFCYRSEALATIASKHHPHSTLIADSLNLPHPDCFFDFAISIAVIHHLSTPVRRVRAIEAILTFEAAHKQNGNQLSGGAAVPSTCIADRPRANVRRLVF